MLSDIKVTWRQIPTCVIYWCYPFHCNSGQKKVSARRHFQLGSINSVIHTLQANYSTPSCSSEHRVGGLHRPANHTWVYLSSAPETLNSTAVSCHHRSFIQPDSMPPKPETSPRREGRSKQCLVVWESFRPQLLGSIRLILPMRLNDSRMLA